MKATDLMIGDWVMVKMRRNDDVKDYPVMVYSGNIGDIASEILIVEPIPLTPEILKKNGFELNKYGYNFENIKECYSIYAEEIPLCNRYFFHINYERLGETYHRCCIHSHIDYVHELQHALRLCGIEKEVVV